MTDYQPIDCGRYSMLELAIMRRRRLRLRWHTPGEPARECEGLAVDLVTRHHEEFLIFQAGDKTHEIRLDHISRMDAASE